MSKEIKAKLLIDIETNFDDDKSDENTIKYLVEQDLEDMGWQINNIAIKNNDKEKNIKHFIFGVLNAIWFCQNYGGDAEIIRKDVLAGYSNEKLQEIISELDCDLKIDWTYMKDGYKE